MKHFINLKDWSRESIEGILKLAGRLKEELKSGKEHLHLKGKNIGMVFDKSSLRTRVSFEVGINQLGGHAIVLGESAGKLGEREPIADFARVASRYLNGLVVRTFEEEKIEALIKYSSMPIINALSDESHPCQSMADFLTLKEHLGNLEDKVLVYVGDSNNVARSLLRMAEKLNMQMRIVSPYGYEFSDEEKNWGKSFGVTYHQDPKEGVLGAHALYTDVWTSMGQEKEKEKRLKDFQGYQINRELLAGADPMVKVLHCLPAHRGEEISEDVIESGHSIVFDQAENRLHVQKAIMVTLFKEIDS